MYSKKKENIIESIFIKFSKHKKLTSFFYVVPVVNHFDHIFFTFSGPKKGLENIYL